MEALLNREHIQQEIAGILKVDTSTVSRERKRQRKNRYYDADTADHKAGVLRANSKYQGMKIEKYPEIKKRIIEDLKQKRAPDEIAGRMKKEKIVPRIGTNAIYKWLYSPYGQLYARYLCMNRRKKRTQKRTGKREMIPNRKPLQDKPKWQGLVEMEGDTFLSPKKSRSTESAFLGTVNGTHLLVGTKLSNLKEETMVRGVHRSTKMIDVDLIIMDNGIENRSHENFTMDAYFCDPHAPWQKPHIEGDIGLLRKWFIPKGTNLKEISEYQFQTYLHILNHKYRKSLGYKSAYEIALEKGIIQEIPKNSLSEKVAFH